MLADTLPFAILDGFLPAPARTLLLETHIALPHFVSVPPDVHEVPPAAMLRLALLDGNPGLATVTPRRPLRVVANFEYSV